MIIHKLSEHCQKSVSQGLSVRGDATRSLIKHGINLRQAPVQPSHCTYHNIQKFGQSLLNTRNYQVPDKATVGPGIKFYIQVKHQSPVCLIAQWRWSSETTAMSMMRDHLSGRAISSGQKVLHLSLNEPVTKDHLSWETIFLWPMGWSFKTGSTVLQNLSSFTEMNYGHSVTEAHIIMVLVCRNNVIG